MALKGMDTDAVRGLATQLSHAHDTIQSLSTQLTNQLQNVQWIGPDREQFVSDWQSQHVSALHTVAQALTDAATRATQNASDQDNVSA